MKKPKTIRQAVNQIVKEYLDLYETFKHDKDSRIRAKCVNLALHDVCVQKIIYEWAYKELQDAIKKREALEVVK